VRCSQTAHLEIDPIRPYALGGSSRERENLRCLCKVHNLYLAGRSFPEHPILFKSFASGGKSERRAASSARYVASASSRLTCRSGFTPRDNLNCGGSHNDVRDPPRTWDAGKNRKVEDGPPSRRSY
jgi:hypothetical protein